MTINTSIKNMLSVITSKVAPNSDEVLQVRATVPSRQSMNARNVSKMTRCKALPFCKIFWRMGYVIVNPNKVIIFGDIQQMYGAMVSHIL